MERQGAPGAVRREETASDQFWISGRLPGGRETQGALEDRVTPGRSSSFADADRLLHR